MSTARHDFRCPLCGWILRDHVGASPVSDPARNPRCTQYQWPLGGTLMQWIPQAKFSGFSDGSSSGGRHDGTKVTIPVEDPGSPTGFRDETISSLSDIRRLERESEQRERNGEGRRMVWRDFSQDTSNQDQHTLGVDPSLTPSKTLSNGAPVTVRRGDAVSAAHGDPDHV